MHAWLVGVFCFIIKDVGLPNMVVIRKARGLRSVDASRHGDEVVLDLFAEDRHLVIDVVATTVYRDTII